MSPTKSETYPMHHYDCKQIRTEYVNRQGSSLPANPYLAYTIIKMGCKRQNAAGDPI